MREYGSETDEKVYNLLVRQGSYDGGAMKLLGK